MYHSKLNEIMKKILIILVFATATLFYGCGKFLNLVPEKDVETIESIFEIRSGAFDFYNSCFSALNMGINVGDYTVDPSTLLGGEYAVADVARKESPKYYLGNILSISDGFQNTNSPYCDLWNMKSTSEQPLPVYTCIRYCNIFIENIDRVNDMNMREKAAWKAEIKCLKALYYFEMVKRYGPIVLIPQNIQTNADIAAMQSPRSPIDECFGEMVRLFDEAQPDLIFRDELPVLSKTGFSKEAALAYKARVLLYAASRLFNGNSAYSQFKNRDGKLLFNSSHDPKKWKLAAEAADEAISVAEARGIRLNKGNVTERSAKLNTIADIRNSTLHTDWINTGEWIFMQKAIYRNSCFINPFCNVNSKYYDSSNSYGLMAPNIATVELFYTDNGLPITKDKTWPYGSRYKMGRETDAAYTDIVNTYGEDVLKLHLRREPRFYANIVSQGIYDTFENTKVLVVPYKGQEFGTMADKFNDGTVLQNITGYWSKKFIKTEQKPGNYSEACVVLMRLSDLYLMQAEAWNEYAGPSEKVYDAIDKIRERAGIPPIRKAWQQYSTSPGEINTKEGLRSAIQQERMIEFVFEGHHCWDLRRWKKAETVLNRVHTGWNVIGKDAKTFFNNFEKPIIVSKKASFVSPRDYFWPIRSEEIMISNIVQNPGW